MLELAHLEDNKCQLWRWAHALAFFFVFVVFLISVWLLPQAEKKWTFNMRVSLGRRPEAGVLAGFSVHVDPAVVSCCLLWLPLPLLARPVI